MVTQLRGHVRGHREPRTPPLTDTWTQQGLATHHTDWSNTRNRTIVLSLNTGRNRRAKGPWLSRLVSSPSRRGDLNWSQVPWDFGKLSDRDGCCLNKL